MLTQALDKNLSSVDWGQVIIGGQTPDQVAERILSGQRLPWFQCILDQARLSGGNMILELGSGTGELSACLALEGFRICVVDFSTEALRFSFELFKLIGKTIEAASESDVTKRTPFSDNMFDMVFNSGLLEHFDFYEKVKIISEARRITRRSFLSLVPNANSIPYRLGKWLQERNDMWKWGKETPVESLHSAYITAGFEDCREWSIAEDHAVNFMNYNEFAAFNQAYKMWISSLSTKEIQAINQGYLLCSLGRK